MIKYTIVSDSMTPLIPVGSAITIEKVKDIKELKRFDILVFKENNKLICHYLWHINKIFDQGKIVTRNLKDGALDVPFEFAKLHGKVTNYRIKRWTKMKIALSDLIK